MKAVIFDFDGTVADTLPLCITSFRKAIEPLAGRSLSDGEIIATFGPSEEGTIMALIPDFYEEGLSSYLSHYEELHGMCAEPFDGMRELLDFLKEQGIIVALVTGKGEQSCRVSLAFYGMENRFDWIETGSPHGQRKTEGIQEVLRQFGLKESEAIYVGDAVSDIHSARATGMPILSAAWGSYTDVDELGRHEPDEILSTVAELRAYLVGRLNP
ncbi:HAD family hydrolase [Paenibacillus sp. HN-1]|uniref:HAD family hydrolase n=1 Tax=Paenibacillus TaxID=44249 RepID=UPI001CA8E5C7|nr:MULTISPECIES: HAD family hydrolase [Paenibacillus]MBY9081791.1 HAD family hydrolase [Paenibacillus sp. CGMCC 1.18879]MBY9086510.1 HAD family hydrolase [Paenibacillus sinensis]